MQKRLGLSIHVGLENENIKISIPLHIRNILMKSDFGEAPIIEITACIMPREFKKWSEFLAELPIGHKEKHPPKEIICETKIIPTEKFKEMLKECSSELADIIRNKI